MISRINPHSAKVAEQVFAFRGVITPKLNNGVKAFPPGIDDGYNGYRKLCQARAVPKAAKATRASSSEPHGLERLERSRAQTPKGLTRILGPPSLPRVDRPLSSGCGESIQGRVHK